MESNKLVERLRVIERIRERSRNMGEKMFRSRNKGSLFKDKEPLIKKKEDTIIESDEGETDAEQTTDEEEIDLDDTDLEETDDDATISAGRSYSISELAFNEGVVEETAESIYEDIAESGRSMDRHFSSKKHTHEALTDAEKEWRATMVEYDNKQAHIANGTWIVTPADLVKPTIEERYEAGMDGLRKRRDRCLARAKQHHEEESRYHSRSHDPEPPHFGERGYREDLDDWIGRVSDEYRRRRVPAPFKPRTSSYAPGTAPARATTAATIPAAVPRTSSCPMSTEAKIKEMKIAANSDGKLDATSKRH